MSRLAMKVFGPMHTELEQAVARSMSYRLVVSPPRFLAPPRLASERVRAEIEAKCGSIAPGRSTGLCQLIATSCIPHIKDRLECEAWVAFGWLSDHAIPGSYFWRMDADDLCRGLTTGSMGVAEFHAWIVLDSGEIIDPVVYPTLAENYKRFSHGSGRCNLLLPDGHPYSPIAGLPLLQYHPQAFLG